MQGAGVLRRNKEERGAAVVKLHLKRQPQEGAAGQSIPGFSEIQG